MLLLLFCVGGGGGGPEGKIILMIRSGRAAVGRTLVRTVTKITSTMPRRPGWPNEWADAEQSNAGTYTNGQTHPESISGSVTRDGVTRRGSNREPKSIFLERHT